MHEGSIAQALLATIIAEAEKQKARPVEAKVICGVLSAVNEQLLREAFEAISKGTVCEAVKLEVEQKPLQGRCKDCGEPFDVEINRPRCPQCGGDKFELLSDTPLTLETIEFETE